MEKIVDIINVEDTPNEQERKQLILNFKQEIQSYTPDWKKIIHTNQSMEKISIEEILDRKVIIFRKRMCALRKSRGLTQAQMAERLSCSKQYVSKIEKSIKNIPIKILEDIHKCFAVPIAYLLGLIDDDICEPDIAEYYFWENPHSKYNIVKSDVINERLLHPMEFFGAPQKTLEEKVFEEIKKHYDLLMLFDDIMNCSKEKKEKMIQIMKFLNKTL